MNQTHLLVLDMQKKLLGQHLGDWQNGKHAAREVLLAGLWQDMCQLQLPDAMVPLLSGEAVDEEGPFFTALMEAFGYHLAPGPILAGIVAGAVALIGSGRTDLLEGLGNGQCLPILTTEEATGSLICGSVTARATPHGTGHRLAGRKTLVPDAAMGTHFIIPARLANSDGALALFLLSADRLPARTDATSLVDGTPVVTLDLHGVELSGDELLAAGEDADRLLHRIHGAMIAALCGEAVGLMQAVLDQTLDYVRQRQQFGKPLARFQALQHDMVQMLIEIEQARSLAIAAAITMDNPVLASSAKGRTNQALRLVTEKAVQLHGGIGTTRELALNHYFRRAMILQQTLGNAAWHQRVLCDHLTATLRPDS